MSEYEIKCQETWAWYSGLVQDYDNTKKCFYVTYPNDWKEPEWVSPESVRRVPPPFAPHWVAKVGDQVEDRYVVSFDGWDDQHNECLLRTLVRPRSTQIPLNPEDIVRDSISIPDELVDWVCSHPKELSSLQDLQSRMYHMNVSGETKELIIVAPERELIMARDIITMIFDKRKKLYELELAMKSKEERVRVECVTMCSHSGFEIDYFFGFFLNEKWQKRKEEESKAIRVEFRIHPLLVGYLYGKNRQNISKENLPPDITAVRLEEGKCTVFGKTQESVLECKEQLHIVAKKVVLSSSETWFLVGTGGKDIRTMKLQSGVQRLITHRRWPEELRLLKERAMDHFRDRRSGGRGGRGRRGGRSRGASRDPSDESDEYSSTITLIEGTELDDLFEDGDILDMTNGAEPDSYLVVIGREDRVNLCLTMIEISLNAVRRISSTRNRVNALRDQISQIKGFTPGSRKGKKGGRGRGGGSTEDGGPTGEDPSGDSPGRRDGRRGGRGAGSRRGGGTPADDDRKTGGDDGRSDSRKKGRNQRDRNGRRGAAGGRQDSRSGRKDDPSASDGRGPSSKRDSGKKGAKDDAPPPSESKNAASPAAGKKRKRKRGPRKGTAAGTGGAADSSAAKPAEASA